MHRLSSLALAMLLLLTSVSFLLGDSHELLTDRLLSRVPSIRLRQFGQLREQRLKTIRELISIVEMKNIDRSFQGPLHRSIELLGEFRVEEAISSLSKMLTYIPEGFEVEEDIAPEAECVAALALSRIGHPAIYTLVHKISGTEAKENNKERDIAAWVIMVIEGKRQALNRFNMLISNNARGKANYEAAKKYVEKNPYRDEDEGLYKPYP